MMKVLTLQSSPNLKGNTITILKSLIKGLSSDCKVETKSFNLHEMRISPCKACFTCSTTRKCIINDDMQHIYPEFEKADVIVFGTPIYWWNMNAQMKLCIDRMTALLRENDSIPVLSNKTLVLIVTYRHQATAQSTINMFKDFIDWAKIKLHVLEYCSMQKHVTEDKDKLRESEKVGKEIADSFKT